MDNFIYSAYLQDLSICDEIIECAKNSPYKMRGKTSESGVNPYQTGKISTDVNLWRYPELCKKYFPQLQIILDEYIKKYPWSNAFGYFGLTDEINIQHYAPNEGFHVWHTERASHHMPESTRHLVFMTYLNDVKKGGETEFFHQKLKVKPKKGLTLIWGADWTFVHRGIPAPKEDKYIVTGWLNFADIDKIYR